jgi:GT2 family glycosyltransferase
MLERVGGFDTVAYAGAVGGEDTDLAWRAIGTGADAVYADDALVFHAVNVLGPKGLLRVAWRWTAALPFAHHPEIRRRHFILGLFRKRTHLMLLAALAGLLLPRGLRPLAVLLAIPYLRALRARGILAGGGMAMAPYYVLHDAIETAATVRGGLRGGRLLL